jgi:hypothetical protein
MSKTKSKNKSKTKTEADRSDDTDVAIADPRAIVAMTGEPGCESALPSNQQPSDACEEAIRVLAHHKWEAAGGPAGDGLDFWLEAEQEVHAERSGSRSAQG